MAIYDGNGNQIFHVYDADSTELNFAYNGEGTQIYQKDSIALKVMTYNVGQWYIGGGDNVPADKDADYYALQNGMIQNADADILFINEYWDTFSKTGRTALSLLSQYFPYIETRNGSSGYVGRAICSKYPLSNYTTHAFSSGNDQYYDTAEITVGDKQITLIVVHLITNPEATRWTQCQEFVSYLETLDTFIAGGDYNTGISPDWDSDNTESTQYIRYVKTFLDEGYHSANCADFGFMVTCNDGVDGAGDDWMIDNIITSSDIAITSAHVDTTKLTDSISAKIDHMPLIAELEVY